MAIKISRIGALSLIALCALAVHTFGQESDATTTEPEATRNKEPREKVPSNRELNEISKELRGQNLVLQEQFVLLQKQVNGLQELLQVQGEQISALKAALEIAQKSVGQNTADIRGMKTDLAAVDQKASGIGDASREASSAAMNYALQVEMRAIAAFSEAQNAATSASHARQAVDVLELRYATHRHLFQISELHGGGEQYSVRSGAEILTPDK